MILGYKTLVNGKPTCFVQKILACKLEQYKQAYKPKIHTIRKGNRWKKGNTIQMATGVGTKDYFQFNGGGIGLDICKNVQSFEIIRADDLLRNSYDDCIYIVEFETFGEVFSLSYKVKVDGRFLTVNEIKKVAVNDGFENAEQMFYWFGDNDFQGQLIHWTDAVY